MQIPQSFRRCLKGLGPYQSLLVQRRRTQGPRTAGRLEADLFSAYWRAQDEIQNYAVPCY